MQAKLIEVGRNKINRTIEIKSSSNPLKQAENECRRFLLSNGVWLTPLHESLTVFQVNAGMRTVGTVEFSSEITKEQLDKYL